MNRTKHLILTENSSRIEQVKSKSVELVVTSPPYPMIEMWDETFSAQNSSISEYLLSGDGHSAFKAMHDILKKVWDECDRVLKDNCFICINIGDATRTIGGDFCLFPNHSEITDYFFSKGYSVLPDIHWRKQSNSPNKFMGSGMYPAGAYVTYEHEYILIFRKGGKRIFKDVEKKIRQESAFFWEERNIWFSDLWDIKGVSQSIPNSKDRTRNASFPFEIPYRLVNMYSVKDDTVLDPFNGMGTTTLACMASRRNSIGIDISNEINNLAVENIEKSIVTMNNRIRNRLDNHRLFLSGLSEDKRSRCYKNANHCVDVKTKQETEIKIDQISGITKESNGFICEYGDIEEFDSPNVADDQSLIDFYQ